MHGTILEILSTQPSIPFGDADFPRLRNFLVSSFKIVAGEAPPYKKTPSSRGTEIHLSVYVRILYHLFHPFLCP